MKTSSSNPGCLASIAKMFGFGGREKTPDVVVANLPADPEPDPYPFRVRDDFLSRAEQSFYMVLRNMMGDHLVICPKVSLGDLFYVTKPNENKGVRNRIDRKHVDFLICEPKTMKPRFAIELDDSSHQRADREERDEFVNSVFNAADLPLLHIPVRNSYSTEDLGVLFKQALQKNVGSSISLKPIEKLDPHVPPVEKSSSGQAPFCPKCGVPMMLRTAKTGERAGEQFYGCRNYPKCRETMPHNA